MSYEQLINDLRILKEKKITCSQLADMAGLSRHTINRYLNDKTSIRPERVRSILDAIGITPEALKEMGKTGQTGFPGNSWYRTADDMEELIKKLEERTAFLETQLQIATEKIKLYDRKLKLIEEKYVKK